MTSTMRVLLTGASGFLGSHMLTRLMSVPGVELHAVNRSGTGIGLGSSVRWHQADMTDERDVTVLINRVRPSHVLANAWTVTPGKFWTDPANLDWIAGYYALLASLSRLDTVPRFVGVGTCAEYDWSGSEFIEDITSIAPTTPYGRSKAVICDAAMKASANGSISAAWGRVFLPYGPGDTAGRLLPSVFNALRQGHRVDLTSGQQLRDFIFAGDVASFFVSLLFSERQGAFNVGTGTPHSIRSAVEYLAEAMGADSGLLLFGAKPDRNEPPSIVADMAKSRDLLDWRPQTGLKAGIESTVRSLMRMEKMTA